MQLKFLNLNTYYFRAFEVIGKRNNNILIYVRMLLKNSLTTTQPVKNFKGKYLILKLLKILTLFYCRKICYP